MTGAPIEPTTVAPGWHPDPWGVGPWRWWDGHAWTAHVAQGQEKKPRLPSWLSVPVVVGGLLTAPFVLNTLRVQWSAVALGLVPLLIVLPVLAWLDRVEPEPRSSRIHAVLWGAAVAGLIAGIINSLVALGAGEVAATVVSAPLIEEASKGLGVYWAVRRREVDSVMDGIVYAGWVAVGFAVVEDFIYFADAADGDMLLEVFVLRALLTPFAHPLFTAWTGLALGLAVARNQSLLANAFWGYGLAVASHAAWNGSLVFAEETGNESAIAIAAMFFFVLFIAGIVAVIVLRRSQQRRFLSSVPMLAQRYDMTTSEVEVFGQWRTILGARRRLARRDRGGFDDVHAALARLSLLHARPGAIDVGEQQRLADQLQRARAAANA